MAVPPLADFSKTAPPTSRASAWSTRRDEIVCVPDLERKLERTRARTHRTAPPTAKLGSRRRKRRLCRSRRGGRRRGWCRRRCRLETERRSENLARELIDRLANLIRYDSDSDSVGGIFRARSSFDPATRSTWPAPRSMASRRYTRTTATCCRPRTISTSQA